MVWPHIEAAKERIENLWAKGTDYSNDIVNYAINNNLLLHLDMDLTGECKLKCFYCDRTPDRFNEISNRKELSINERKNLILQAKALGAKTIEFPGAGEPMIDEDFWEIMEFIYNNNMIQVLFTSGYHLNRESIARLYDLGATIFLKYNSIKPDIQDKIVGVQGYGKKSEDALNLLIEYGFNKSIPTRMAIDMVVTPQYHNMEEIENIFRWCRINNVHNYIMTLIPEGLADRQKLILEKQRSNNLIERLQKIDENEFGLKYRPSRPMAGGYRCRQVNVGLFINLFGEVYDCNGLGRFIGHIRKDTLKDIWNSKFAQHIRSPLQNGFCLLRERVWDGLNTSGMERKLEEYREWEKKHGSDSQVLRGLDVINTGLTHRHYI
jgi:MoaA/NifB/PqqE/SkfB family radical SAM enzyme